MAKKQRCDGCNFYLASIGGPKGECTFPIRTPASVTVVPINVRMGVKPSDGENCRVFKSTNNQSEE